MCVRCGTGTVAWCTSPDRHESEEKAQELWQSRAKRLVGHAHAHMGEYDVMAELEQAIACLHVAAGTDAPPEPGDAGNDLDSLADCAYPGDEGWTCVYTTPTATGGQDCGYEPDDRGEDGDCPAGHSSGWLCTRWAGHKMPHKARGANGELYATWEN
jgi:hypothetical protein